MSTSFALPGQSNTLQANVNGVAAANNSNGIGNGKEKDSTNSAVVGNEKNDQASLAAGLTTVNGIVPTLQ